VRYVARRIKEKVTEIINIDDEKIVTILFSLISISDVLI
jgi:hypothetical protein